MTAIQKNLEQIRKNLPDTVTLVAVSKTKSVSEILEAYQAGQRIFGENKVQELTIKHPELPKDIKWHMIGHLQRNKVKYIAEFIDLIHGVDSLRLLKEIDKRAAQAGRKINCLLQIHIAEEQSKFGFDGPELREILRGNELEKFENITIKGLMGMATFTENTQQLNREFGNLKQLFDELQKYHPSVDTLSMGMSGDYALAIAAGSTMVRIGSSIFGSRNYG